MEVKPEHVNLKAFLENYKQNSDPDASGTKINLADVEFMKIASILKLAGVIDK